MGNIEHNKSVAIIQMTSFNLTPTTKTDIASKLSEHSHRTQGQPTYRVSNKTHIKLCSVSTATRSFQCRSINITSGGLKTINGETTSI